jgi:hypothetical protein
MKKVNQLRWTSIFLFLLIFIVVSSGRGADVMLDWRLENGWSIINQTEGGYEFVALGQGKATYEKHCAEGPLKLSFGMKNLQGILNANINIYESARYVISFVNNGNETLSTYLIKIPETYQNVERYLFAATPNYQRIVGQTIPYSPEQEYDIEIISYGGQIRVGVQVERSAAQTLINYSDENPLPFGGISFETPDDIEIANEVHLLNVRIKCTPPNMEIPSLGVGYFKQPASNTLISTQWGYVPANQVLVVVDRSIDFQEAQVIARQLAEDLGGSVVGEFQIINLFQIETTSDDLEGLMSNLSSCKRYPSVKLAFPNEQVYLESSPLDDRVYLSGRSGGYDLVKVRDAWNATRGENLCDVRVGVTDNGLYRGYGEFSGPVEINTSAADSNLTAPPKDEKFGSHGTGVMNLLAADPDNGGIVGIASEPLREKLKVAMINIFRDNRAYVTNSLLGLKQEIESRCTILSCSWGDSNADEDTVNSYYDFFAEMQDRYPCLLFVCSAGNNGRSLDGSKRIPNGIELPNIITVGNVLNNGKLVTGEYGSNMNSDNFNVTIAAPGENAVWGWNRKDINDIQWSQGGTSMATPYVTATAAMIRSMRPDIPACQIKMILLNSATSPFAEQKDKFGGILNIFKAVNAARAAICYPCGKTCQNCSAIAVTLENIPVVEGNVNPETSTELGTVMGRVYNIKTGEGVASAEITYRQWPDGKEINSTTFTDSNGNYSLNLPPGRYQIGILSPQYGRDKKSIVFYVYQNQISRDINLGVYKRAG